MREYVLGPIAAFALLAVFSAGGARAADAPRKTISLVVYGQDPCPKGDPDEIVVCAHKPDNERYRIPKELRAKQKEPHGGTSWASQWAAADDQTRYTRPNSCSPVGSGGQTGCFNMMMRQYYAERRAAQDEANQIP
jgi:hypothetical protein